MASQKRKGLSKKIRFGVFKRDAFTCQYCGRHPPTVTLEIDHIIPVSKGGVSDDHNLITACFDCNRGKSGELLSVVPEGIVERTARLIEHEEQLRALNRMLTSKRRRQNKQIKKIQDVFEAEYDWVFTQSFEASIRNNFLPMLDQSQLEEAIYKACAKCDSPDAATKYFCGICWNMIRNG